MTAARRAAVAAVAVACASVVPASQAGALGRGEGSARSPGRTAGDQVWASRDAGPGGAEDRFGGMALSPNGATVYAARSSDGAFVLVARDAATGARRWSVRAPGPAGAQAFANGIAVSPNGSRVFVTGQVERTVDTRTPMTVAYDSTDGSVAWIAAPPNGPRPDIIPRRIAVSPSGDRVFVTGSATGTFDHDDFWDYWTVAYSVRTGARLWRAMYAGPARGGDTAEGLGVGPTGGRVFVTGTSAAGGNDRDIVTVAYDAADGSRRWTTRYAAEADDFATDLAVSPGGSRVYVAGFGRHSFADPHGYRLIVYVARSGERKGVARYVNGEDDSAADLALSGDGSRAFVTGSGGQDFLTVAFDTTSATPVWFVRYDGGHGIDNAYAVAVHPDGTAVDVTGESEQGLRGCFGDVSSTAFATVEYDAATGDERWVARYAGASRAPDQARSVAVSPNGSRVLVAGDSDFICRNSDVATVGYAGE